MQRIHALLAALFLMASLAAPAAADPPHAFIAFTQGLQDEAEAMGGAPAPEGFVRRTALFAGAARALADQIQAEGGPADLPCIFRGMAADVEARTRALGAASDEAAREREYAALTELFSHAVIFAGQVDIESPGGGLPAPCPVTGQTVTILP